MTHLINQKAEKRVYSHGCHFLDALFGREVMINMMRSLQRISPILSILSLLLLGNCQEEQLGTQTGILKVTAQPSSGQSALDNPIGIDLGKVPIFGQAQGLFTLENVTTTLIHVQSIEIDSPTGGKFTAGLVVNGQTMTPPFEIDTISSPNSIVELRVAHSPNGQDGDLESATLRLHTDAGPQRNQVVEVQLSAQAWFIGEPNLEIQYQSVTYRMPEDCTFNGDPDVCQLETLNFGNVSLSSTASTNLLLRNLPTANTCLLSPLADGSPDCTPACALTFDKDAGGQDLGLGFAPADAGFALSGSASVPFILAPQKAECASSGNIVRGELTLVVNFTAGDTLGAKNSTLVLESNGPSAPRIAIPLNAQIQEGPVAKAQIKTCSDDFGLPQCIESADSIQPLTHLYFDGSQSSDPNGEAIVAYHWEIVQYPDGANPQTAIYNPVGADTPDYAIFVPLAGTYVVRLQVTNAAGVTSGIGAQSDVTFTALPESRVHIQLVWDHPDNDQDLHLVKVNEENEAAVFHTGSDCFWRQCRFDCAEDDNCDPIQWFDTDPPLEGSNPRLDRDDTSGIGPENINIDAPNPGRYRVYVHYYGLTNADNAATEATLRIYIDGLLRHEARATLQSHDLWASAEIYWKADSSAEIITPHPDAQNIVQLPYVPDPTTGYNFTPNPF
jgi:hypothetical protein